MRRRDLLRVIGTVAVGASAWPGQRADAQAGRMKRVGILATAALNPITSLKLRLHEHGWVDGKTVQYEERWGRGDDRSYPRLAAELAASPVDVMVTWGTPALLAAKRATGTIPIVMAGIGDPIAVGAVSNLARPGGNVTATSSRPNGSSCCERSCRARLASLPSAMSATRTASPR